MADEEADLRGHAVSFLIGRADEDLEPRFSTPSISRDLEECAGLFSQAPVSKHLSAHYISELHTKLLHLCIQVTNKNFTRQDRDIDSEIRLLLQATADPNERRFKRKSDIFRDDIDAYGKDVAVKNPKPPYVGANEKSVDNSPAMRRAFMVRDRARLFKQYTRPDGESSDEEEHSDMKKTDSYTWRVGIGSSIFDSNLVAPYNTINDGMDPNTQGRALYESNYTEGASLHKVERRRDELARDSIKNDDVIARWRVENLKGSGCLHILSVHSRFLDWFRILVEEGNASVYIKDDRNDTPLSLAIMNDNLHLALYLLGDEKFTNPPVTSGMQVADDFLGLGLPLSIGRSKNEPIPLIANEERFRSCMWHIILKTDSSDKNPVLSSTVFLQVYEIYGKSFDFNQELIELMLLYCINNGKRVTKVKMFLVDLGLSGNIVDKNKRHTGTYLALANNEQETYDLLIKYGGKPPYFGKDLREEAREYGCLCACARGDLAAVRTFFSSRNPPRLHFTDQRMRNSMLHWAAQNCRTDVCLFLLDKQANPNQRNIAHRSPADLCGNKELGFFLKESIAKAGLSNTTATKWKDDAVETFEVPVLPGEEETFSGETFSDMEPNDFSSSEEDEFLDIDEGFSWEKENYRGHVIIEILGAHAIPVMDDSLLKMIMELDFGADAVNPFVEMIVGSNESVRTSVKQRDLSPRWEPGSERYMFKCDGPETIIKILVWDKEYIGTDSFIGSCFLNLKRLCMLNPTILQGLYFNRRLHKQKVGREAKIEFFVKYIPHKPKKVKGRAANKGKRKKMKKRGEGRGPSPGDSIEAGAGFL